ncbi:MAG: hypothetical protein ABSE89_11250 [Sedimentisphaerales bacterium]
MSNMKCGNCGSKLQKPKVDEVGYGSVELLCPICGIVYDKKGKEVENY